MLNYNLRCFRFLQGSGKTSVTLDESDAAERNISESGEDLSNGKLVQDSSAIKNKGIKRRHRIKRHVKGGASVNDVRSEEPVPFASRKRRKFLRNAKPEAHSDSTVSLSADGVCESGTGSKTAEDGVTVAKRSDISRPVEAPVSEPPVVEKRRPGRPKKKPVIVSPTKPPEVALRDETQVKVTTENPISSQSVSLSGANDGPTGCPDSATSLSERPQDGPAGPTRAGSVAESVLPENHSTRSNDVAMAILPILATTAPASPEPQEAAVAATTNEHSSQNDVLAKDGFRSNGTTSDAETTTHDVQKTNHDVSPETSVLPSDRKAEQESVDEASTYGAADPLPVCPSDKAPSGDTEAQDGVNADHKQTEDDVIVSCSVKDDAKKGSSPVRDDVTETSSTAPNTTEPRFAFLTYHSLFIASVCLSVSICCCQSVCPCHYLSLHPIPVSATCP